MKTIIKQINPIIDYKFKGYCLRPYDSHPKGCPNFNNPNRPDCPPRAPKFDEYFDMEQPIYAIIVEFDLATHASNLKAKILAEKGKTWTNKQAMCPLYWQGSVRKELKLQTNNFLKTHPQYTANYTPEAMGLSVTETLKEVGIILEWPAVNIVRKVVVVGVKK
jgi:predicted metal-binding protein